MYNTRWWDIAVAAGLAAIAALSLAGLGAAGPSGWWLTAVSLFVFVAGYAFLRPGIVSGAAPTWRLAVGIPLVVLAIVIGIAAAPFLAMLQTLAYPLVWVTTPARREAIVGSAGVAAATFVGFLLNGAFSSEAMWSGLLTAGVSLVFAVSLGLWISAIAEYGEDRARLVAELTDAQEQVERLSRERGAADERERLGRDIHDTLAQTLAGLTLLSERAGRQLARGETDAAAGTIATVEQLSRDALAEARGLVARTAAVPGDAVLEAAVERLAERFRAEAGLVVQVEVALEGDDGMTRDAQLVVLRCLQEALSNVRKHAGAASVRVIVEADASGIRLAVVDDGRGFDPDRRRTGYGLDGMADRVALAGGTLTIDTTPDRGTVLTVALPIATPPLAGLPEEQNA